MKLLIRSVLLSSGAVCAICVFAMQDIRVRVDGRPIVFADVQPMMVEGRVMVPLRGVFEELGSAVVWLPADRKVQAKKGKRDIKLFVNKRTAPIDGRPVQLEVAPRMIRGRTMVPLRFVAEALDCHVDWHDDTMTVVIRSAN